MPVTKTTAKKAVKTAAASKPVKKTARKVTIDDVWAGFERLEKSQEEVWKVIRETQERAREAQERAQEAQERIQEAQEKAQERAREAQEKAQERAREAQEKAREAQERIQKAQEKAQERAQEAQERTREAQERIQKAQEEAWKAIRETQQNIGGINNTLGSLVERVMTPDLPRRFKQFGFAFNRITTIKWAVEGNIYAEIDGLLENGAQAMVVEVKTTLREKDIDDHLIRMEKVRAYADDHGDKRQFLGAMAAAITSKETKEYALSKGFFVIEPSGEDVKITKPVSDPMVW